MTDLELTKRCAEKMGYENPRVVQTMSGSEFVTYGPEDSVIWPQYWPLHNDGQLMALIRKFHLNIGQTTRGVKVFTTPLKGGFQEADDENLNRAVCLCVANL